MKQEEKGKASEVSISGQGKNLYLVNWSRVANFGYNLLRGDSEQEVFEQHPFSKNNEVNFIITKISEDNLPIVFKRC